MPIYTLDNDNTSSFPCISVGKFHLEAGYPKYKGSNDGQEAVLKGWVNYDEYPAFIAQMQPPSTAIGGNQIIQYGAELPGFPWLRVTDWDAEPFPGNRPLSDLDANNYRKHPLMYVTLVFRFVKQQATGGTGTNSNPDPAPFLIHRWSIGGQVLSLDNQGLMWDDIRRRLSGGGPEPFFKTPVGPGWEECHASKRRKVGVLVGQTEKVNAIKLLPHIEHEITWPRVPRPGFTYMKQAVGKVNQFEMTFRTGKIPPECLLFTGARIQETVMSNGETSWELVMSFSERQVKARDQDAPGGWNHFFRSNKPSQAYPFLVDEDPESTVFTKTSFPGPIPGPVTGFSLDSDTPQKWYSCTGLPGFYRLELNPGDFSLPCIKETVDSSGVLTGIDLQTGYLDDLAIFEKYPFAKLFKPEPLLASPSAIP